MAKRNNNNTRRRRGGRRNNVTRKSRGVFSTVVVPFRQATGAVGNVGKAGLNLVFNVPARTVKGATNIVVSAARGVRGRRAWARAGRHQRAAASVVFYTCVSSGDFAKRTRRSLLQAAHGTRRARERARTATE